MTITQFGTFEDAPVYEARLTSSAGVEVRVLNYGAVVRDWRVPDRSDVPQTVTLGFDTFEPYPLHSRSFGIIAGRVANRIRDARFTLDGKVHQLEPNEGANQLHGGKRGFGRRLWEIEADGSAARLRLESADGDMGFPGKVDVTVEFRLTGNTLVFDMTAVPDRPTPISLAQHSYYALGGPIAAHTMVVNADRYTETGAGKLPTGAVPPVDGTMFDFRSPRAIGDAEIDVNFCLTHGDPALTLTGETMALALSTDRPGVQVYDGYDMPPVPVPGLGGARYGTFAGIAIEAQDWPDAVNNPTFPSVIHTPDDPYRQTTRVTITPR
ncbi:galactose mutarotase [Acuticoccus sp. M5D2P5]|uniref:aldose epimerase family protein n=1 Tax=Acuticoccus kalidii TaxID=2910977 RepID=UPI001F2A0692|nr:aldose epimerase family protein [Acuticoccus kalidii]MCF3936467.1 galactose mutarotase [Acuticoccus kalidii]